MVSWDAIADAAGDFDHYNVYGGTNAGTINPDSLLTPSGTTGTWYSHTGLSNGTTYYYEVTSVDATGNESNPATANATPAQAPLAFGDLNIESIIDAGSDGDMDATVDAYLNRSAFVKARFRNQDGSYPAGTWLTPSSIDWYGLYDTAIGTATFYNDGTDIDVTWTAGDYGREQLEVSIAGGAWTLVDANATSPYNYTADQRYPLRFRVFGVDSDPIAYSDTVTAGTFYNQCQYLYTQWQAAEVQDVDVITSAEVAAFFQTPDLVAPDTTGVFAGVTVDTTSGFVVLTLDDMTIEEPGQVWVQWLNTSGFVWTGPEEWNPVTAATTVGDSVHTGKTTAQYDGEIIFTRFKLRDDESTPNVSAWVDHQEPFVRASEGDYEVASMGFYPTAWVSGSNVKVVIYDSSKNLVATSSGTALTGTNAWETASWAGPTLVAGSDYYIGVIADGSIKVGATSVYNSNLDDTGSYASPPDPVSGTGQAAGVLCVYVKNAAGTVLLGYDGAADGTASAYLGGKVAYTSSSYTVATQ